MRYRLSFVLSFCKINGETGPLKESTTLSSPSARSASRRYFAFIEMVISIPAICAFTTYATLPTQDTEETYTLSAPNSSVTRLFLSPRIRMAARSTEAMSSSFSSVTVVEKLEGTTFSLRIKSP